MITLSLRCGSPQGGRRSEGFLDEYSAGHVVFSTPMGRCPQGSNAFCQGVYIPPVEVRAS